MTRYPCWWKILSPPLVWTKSVSSSVQSLMLDNSALFLMVVAVEDEYSMILLGSIISFVAGKNWVKDAPTCRLVALLLHLSGDGQLPE